MRPTQQRQRGNDADEIWIHVILAPIFFVLWSLSTWRIHDIPNKQHVALTLIGILAIFFAPSGLVKRIRIPTAMVLFVFWAYLSKYWSAFPAGFDEAFRHHFLDIPVVMGIATVLGSRKIISLSLKIFYVVVPYTYFYSITHAEARQLTNEVNTVRSPSWHGAFIHKNVMLSYFAFGIIVMLTFEKRKWIKFTYLALTMAMIMLSRSSTGLVIPVVLIVTYLWARSYQRSSDRRLLGFLTFVATAVLIVATQAILPLIASAVGKDLTFTGRTEIWSAVIRQIAKRPWQGFGLDGVWKNPSIAPTNEIYTDVKFSVANAHNGILDVMLQLGIVGATFLVVFTVQLWRRGIRLVRQFDPIGMLIIMVCASQIFLSISESFLLSGIPAVMTLLYCVVPSEGLSAHQIGHQTSDSTSISAH